MIDFDVWGCRGSRNLVPIRSEIGNRTSCFSVLIRQDGREPAVFVFDAGRGIAALSYAMTHDLRFTGVKVVHVLVTHAHMDHWEGLKDADWFWQRGNGVNLTIHGTAEALGAIRGAFEPPSYVQLEKLAEGTVAFLRFHERSAGNEWRDADASLSTVALYHYSGTGNNKRFIDTLGFRLEIDGGPVLSYLSDHEPTEATVEAEQVVTRGAHLAVFDCHYMDRSDHAFGHGSQEHGAHVARANPKMDVLAGHISPNLPDEAVRAAYLRHKRELENFHLAIEGETFSWNGTAGRFQRKV